MDHLLTCDCGRVLSVSRSQAGQEMKCDCGKVLHIPTLRGLAKLPSAVPDSSQNAENQPLIGSELSRASQAPKEASRTHWQGWRGPSMALATAGFLTATAFCGWFLVQRWSIDTSYTAESEIQAGNEVLDQADPADLTQIWDVFGKMGLNTKDPPAFHLWNIYAQDREKMAKMTGSIAAVFGLIAAAIWMSARGKS